MSLKAINKSYRALLEQAFWLTVVAHIKKYMRQMVPMLLAVVASNHGSATIGVAPFGGSSTLGWAANGGNATEVVNSNFSTQLSYYYIFNFSVSFDKHFNYYLPLHVILISYIIIILIWHIFFPEIYSKVVQNAVVQACPAVVHFGGFRLGEVHQEILRLVNVSTDVQRMHVLPPQTKYFKIHYKKKVDKKLL